MGGWTRCPVRVAVALELEKEYPRNALARIIGMGTFEFTNYNLSVAKDALVEWQDNDEIKAVVPLRHISMLKFREDPRETGQFEEDTDEDYRRLDSGSADSQF